MHRIVGALLLAVVVGGGGEASARNEPAPDMSAVCPCDTRADGEAWTTHGEYVVCVVAEARRQRVAGIIRPKQMRAAMRAARRSTCGDPLRTVCCIYRDDNDDVGQCRIMSANACDVLDDRLSEGEGEADDMGSGSCAENPCAL